MFPSSPRFGIRLYHDWIRPDTAMWHHLTMLWRSYNSWPIRLFIRHHDVTLLYHVVVEVQHTFWRCFFSLFQSSTLAFMRKDPEVLFPTIIQEVQDFHTLSTIRSRHYYPRGVCFNIYSLILCSIIVLACNGKIASFMLRVAGWI